MKVGIARKTATQWVKQYAVQEEGYRGAYFSGSTVGLTDDAVLPATSDIDVVVVVDRTEPPPKPGKFIYEHTLMEVTFLAWHSFISVNEVLTSYHLAGSFRVNTIIDDPTGHLNELQKQVSRSFAESVWVRRRCENAREKIENGLHAIDPTAPMHDQVTSWLFPTGVTTHVLLVAALRNPTVRLRYLAVRDVLTTSGHEDFYPEFLKLLGCHNLTPKRVEHHLDELARTFDIAASEAKTPFFFRSDITPATRSIAIEGSRELIRSGSWREAVFWIVATFARCHKILATDAPELHQVRNPAFQAVITDLGIPTTDAIIHRAVEVTRFIPRLWDMTEVLMSTNPDISHSSVN